MKKMLTLALALTMMVSAAACGSTKNGNANGETGSAVYGENQSQMADQGENNNDQITVTCLNGTGETVEITVPRNPKRVAVLDFAALDILDSLGLGSRVTGTSNVSLEYLSSYNDREDIMALGTIKEADMEALMECRPEIIFMGGRMSEYYDAFSEIAPVVRLTTDSELGVVESTRKNSKIIASVFGMENEIDKKLEAYEERIHALAESAEGKTALVGIFSGGSLSLLGNDGRCSMIGKEIGFENIGIREEASTSTHGNEVSYEFIADANPDYIFVMDRDAAIGTQGAALAQDVIENELVKQTDAYKKGRIIYLENPGVWYTAEGGITALDIMISDLENALQEY